MSDADLRRAERQRYENPEAFMRAMARAGVALGPERIFVISRTKYRLPHESLRQIREEVMTEFGVREMSASSYFRDTFCDCAMGCGTCEEITRETCTEPEECCGGCFVAYCDSCCRELTDNIVICPETGLPLCRVCFWTGLEYSNLVHLL